jgi:hypothetical protein
MTPIEQFKLLPVNGIFVLKDLADWVSAYENTYNNYVELRRINPTDQLGLFTCCFADIPCVHSEYSEETKFYNFYCSINKLVKLHQYEEYSKEEFITYNSIKNDDIKLKEWVIKNYQLGSEILLCFLVDYLDYSAESHHLKIYQSSYPEIDILVERNDFASTINFIESFNELFWIKRIYAEGLPELKQ